MALISLRSLCLVGVMSIPTAWAADAPVTADTYIDSTARTVNYGRQPTLAVGGSASALIQFDLSTLQSLALTSSDIRKATITLFVDGTNGQPGGVNIGLPNQP